MPQPPKPASTFLGRTCLSDAPVRALCVKGGFNMLAKCANPSCSTPLVYLREGKIFMIESPQQARPALVGPPGPKPQSRVEHFWLCGPCSSSLTLTCDRHGAVQVVLKASQSLRAAAS